MNTDRASEKPVPDAGRGGWSRVRDFLTISPSRMLILGLVLAAMFTLTAVVGGLATRALDNAGREAVTSASRMSRNAQEIFRGLSEVDAAATGRFLAQADPSRRGELDERYREELHRVRGLLSSSVGHTAGDARRAVSVARIANQLPVYTGLVQVAEEMARVARIPAPDGGDAPGDGGTPATGGTAATDRGAPATERSKVALLGAAYLREASGYLRDVLLPAAERLWNEETARLRGAQRAGQVALVASFAVPLVTLGLLLWGQRWLRRRTRRRINPGLALATVAMLATLGWLGVSWWHWPGTESRLAVIDTSLDGHWAQIKVQRGALQGRVDIWCRAYQDYIHEQEREGEHAAAVEAALPGGRVAVAFDAYDTELRARIDERGNAIARQLELAPDPVTYPGGATLLLSVIATAGTGAGIWARIREYR